MIIPNCPNLIVRSNCTNPHLNLALEDWLFRKGPSSQTCLILWRNLPCVVVGRNQNPWVECNVTALHAASIPIIRRYSGGGTVYHDLGNSLYSVIMPRDRFSRDTYVKMIVEALHRVRPSLYLSPRHDIFNNGAKVSGSAYRIIRERAYHHGTMLLDTDLSLLRNFLKSPLSGDMCGGGAAISSVVSPVCKIGSIPGLPTIDHEKFTLLVMEQFLRSHSAARTEVLDLTEADLKVNSEIRAIASELESVKWTFDKTPSFNLKLSSISIFVEDGKITKSSNDELIGQPFTVELCNSLLSPPNHLQTL